MKFKKTKAEFPICPYFIWQSEHDSDENISICFCNHVDNPDECESNCRKELCPLLKGAKRMKGINDV